MLFPLEPSNKIQILFDSRKACDIRKVLISGHPRHIKKKPRISPRLLMTFSLYYPLGLYYHDSKLPYHQQFLYNHVGLCVEIWLFLMWGGQALPYFKFITHAPYGLYIISLVSQFRTKLLHMGIDGSCITEEIIIPDTCKNALSA